MVPDGLVEGVVLLHLGDVLDGEGPIEIALQIVVVVVDALDAQVHILNRVLESLYVVFQHLGILVDGVVRDEVVHLLELLGQGLDVQHRHADFALMDVSLYALHAGTDERGGALGGLALEGELLRVLYAPDLLGHDGQPGFLISL